MHRFLLGCFLPLLLLLPVQAQRGQGIMRASTLWQESASAEIVAAQIQQVLDKAIAEKTMRTMGVGAYRLTSLPNFSLPVTRLPNFPLPQNTNIMYRGMALKSPTEQLKYILQNGLETSKCLDENFASYDGINSSCSTNAIYASTDPDLALGFTAFHLKEGDAHFPVLFHLKRLANSLFISVPHDIPPEWIERVSTVLNINGKLLWGELKLDKSNEYFIFMPYPTK